MFATLAPTASDSDLELLEETPREGQQLRTFTKVAVVVVSAACVAAAAVAAFGRANFGTEAVQAEAATMSEVGLAMGLASSPCSNTPGWTNGFAACNTNGYRGAGCEATGLNCNAYQANNWCHLAFATGPAMNSPEANCCACGGGVLSADALQVEAAPAPSVAPTSCAAYSLCAEAGLSGECCPNGDGVQLDCCNSALACIDTPDWTNGYADCGIHMTEEHGCTDSGVTCAGYVNQTFCSGGQGKKWTLGPKFNSPEINCCACGKAIPA